MPASAEVTLLYVVASDVEDVAEGARAGLLGRRPPLRPAQEPPVEAISTDAARDLLAAARHRFDRPAELEIRRGRVEREVVQAAAAAELLVMARDGDRGHLGPQSIGPQARFVLDHAAADVLLVWADEPPEMATLAP